MKQLKRILLNFLSIFSLFIINIKIFILKRNKKNRIIFYYYPYPNVTKTQIAYMEQFLKKFKNCLVFIGIPNFIKYKGQYFTIKQFYLKWIIGADLFVSNIVCDVLIKKCLKIYIHHDIYDTPLLAKSKEDILARRLSNYDYIFIPSSRCNDVFQRLFKNYRHKPKIRIIGEYLKLTYLLKRKKIKIYKDNHQVVIAPSGYHGVPQLSMKNYLPNLIEILLNKNIKVVFRPHPTNINDPITLKIVNIFKDKKKFKLDKSLDYFKVYSSSSIMITDYSGTAYTYALLTKNPVIFFSVNEKYINKEKYNRLNYFKDRKTIGLIANNPNRINYYLKKILKNKKKFKKNIIKIKKKHFSNKRKSLNNLIFE